MKATDLMIWDWVKVPDGDKWFFGIVCGIDRDNVLVVKPGKSIAYPYAEECLEPIPLTPEILEKNGFRWTGSGDRTMMCGTPYDFEGIRYNLYVGLGKKYIEVHAAMTEKKDERWRKVNKTYLEVCGCYIHELQHALKLCGIDKEIAL